MITARINDKEITVVEGTTILEAAKSAGIDIPHLCHNEKFSIFGGCRICLVEVAGIEKPVASCSTYIADDMVVKTSTERIRRLQKRIIEFLLSDHPNECISCDACGNCRLQDLAYKFGVKGDIFNGEKRDQKTEDTNQFIIRDFNKCILCGKCVRVCDEIRGVGAIAFTGRGFDSKIAASFDDELDCEFCGHCVDICPTGSLTEKSAKGKGRSYELRKVDTVCGYCGVGCNIRLYINNENEIIKVKGKDGNPSNNDGALCVKGKFGYDFINREDRLTTPLIKKERGFEPVSWDEALGLIAARLNEIKREYGPDSIGGLCSAKCTNEENYLFQKFMRGAIGTNNVDHCARLCHAPSATGLIMAFGSGAMTNSTNDILKSDVILVIGSNTIETHPVSALKIKDAVRNRGAKLILVDPRKIELVKYAAIWIDLHPGTNIAFLNGMLNVIIEEGLIEREFIEKRTENFEEMKEAVAGYTPDVVEKIISVPKEKIIEAARLFGRGERCSIFYGMGITQHTTGTETVLSLANLSLVTGNIGREGTGVNPLRGQNNVQGACDMGGLPDVYPGYQKISDKKARERFEKAWGVTLSQNKGLTSTEMVDMMIPSEIDNSDKRIRAIYIMGENPLISDPNLSHTKKALSSLDFLIVQDIFLTETAKLADVILPGTSFAEKDGTFTNTDRRVQLVRKAIEPIGSSREDSQIIMELSERLNYPMKYSSPSEIWDEIASIWPAAAGINYNRLSNNGGIPWPCPDSDHPGTQFLYKDSFPRGLGKFHAVEFMPAKELPDKKYPLILNTGRWLFHFQTGTMSRRARGIDRHIPEGYVEISQEDAREIGISDMETVEVSSRRGKLKIKAKVTNRSPKGMVFIPFHFDDSAANILTNNVLDPYVKMPEYKVCAVRVKKIQKGI
ncbi:MAG: formate dehydrogenase subunit alpha [Nitrospirota bacterium]